jgi:hypothetical protein
MPFSFAVASITALVVSTAAGGHRCCDICTPLALPQRFARDKFANEGDCSPFVGIQVSCDSTAVNRSSKPGSMMLDSSQSDANE